ncbi:hypothetical protein SALBM311S_08212 [Streptomyces alboniger]
MQDTAADTRPFEELSPIERGHRNRLILAGRCGWPDGLAESMNELERRFPAWAVSYYHVNGRDGVPVGSLMARLRTPVRDYSPRLVADSADELAGMLADAEESRAEKVCPTCGQKRKNLGQ